MYTIAIALAIAAPAPPHRPKPAVPVVGDRRMLWSQQEWVVGFGKDGYYECYRPGCDEVGWVGTWKQDGRTIHITERPVHDPEGCERVLQVAVDDIRPR